MQIFNGHTHTMFSHDGKGSVENLCEAAILNNLSGFAVTDHCDCECADDKNMLRNLKYSFSEAEKYKSEYEGRLIISRGIELGEALFNPSFAEKIISSEKYDVILCSVHAVRIDNWDMPFSLIDFSDLSDEFIDRYVTQYFIDLLETATSLDYDILCHLTVVLRYIVYKYKRYVDIKKHYPVIDEILKTVIRRNKTLEINTSGIDNGYFMPDTDIIKRYKALGGKSISIGSDAHSPGDIGKGLNEGAVFLKSTGFSELTYYDNRKPVTYKI